MRIFLISQLMVVFLGALQAQSFADSTMVYIYNAPESVLDRRYDYQWEILKTALEKTTAKYGGYRLEPAVSMSEARQAHELKNVTGRLTVMYLDTNPEFEKTLLPVRIPVDKNLVGFRVFLIRKEDQPKFQAIKTLDDLRKFSIGAGSDWADVAILRKSGFTVVTGSAYDGLFDMLHNKRFDIFSRGAVEIIDEYEQRKEKMPDLHIEETILLYYPLPMYFWFSNTPAGARLAERAKAGMLMMIDDGTYDAIFLKYHRKDIKKLNLKGRKIFKIENPLLAPETPFDNKRLWYDPLKN